MAPYGLFLVAGLALGAIYALSGVGLVVLYRATGVLNLEPLAPKFGAFGWFVPRVDGNDIAALVGACDGVRNHAGTQPRIVICDTRMAKGVPFLEARERNHFLRVDSQEWRQAIEIIDAGISV